MPNGYTRKESSEILEMAPHTIQLYTDRGIIIPDVYAPKGRGTTRIYSKKNLLELAIVRELGKKGIRLEIIKTIFTIMRKSLKADEYRYFDPDAGSVGIDKVYMVIFDPDAPTVRVTLIEKTDPERGDFPQKLEERRERILKDRDILQLSMKNFSSAIILDVSRLWGVISRKA